MVKSNVKLNSLPMRVYVVAIVHTVLIVVLSVLSKDVSEKIWVYSFLRDYLHPLISILFYSPGMTIRIVSILLVVNMASKEYPNNKVVNRTVLSFVLFTIAITMLIVNPVFFVSMNILVSFAIYYIARLFYNWKYPHKMLVFYLSVSIILFVTSSIPPILIIWFKSFHFADVSESATGDSTSSNLDIPAPKVTKPPAGVVVKLQSIKSTSIMERPALFDTSFLSRMVQDLVTVYATFTNSVVSNVVPLHDLVGACGAFVDSTTAFLCAFFDGTNLTVTSEFPHGVPTGNLDSIDAYAEYGKSDTSDSNFTSSREGGSAEKPAAENSSSAEANYDASNIGSSDAAGPSSSKGVEDGPNKFINDFCEEHSNMIACGETGQKIGQVVANLIPVPVPKEPIVAGFQGAGHAIGAAMDAMNNENNPNFIPPERGESPSHFNSYEYRRNR